MEYEFYSIMIVLDKYPIGAFYNNSTKVCAVSEALSPRLGASEWWSWTEAALSPMSDMSEIFNVGPSMCIEYVYASSIYMYLFVYMFIYGY